MYCWWNINGTVTLKKSGSTLKIKPVVDSLCDTVINLPANGDTGFIHGPSTKIPPAMKQTKPMCYNWRVCASQQKIPQEATKTPRYRTKTQHSQESKHYKKNIANIKN